MKSVPGPLNGYHEMKHNPAVTCQNQLKFWNQNRFSQSVLSFGPGFSLGGWLMGGFLTICYCSRTIGCFPYCFLEIFVGDKTLMEGAKLQWGGYCFPIVFWKFFGVGQGLDGEDKVVMEDPPSPPTKENPVG